MNTHLSIEEFVDAIDGTLPGDRRAHLQTCEACRREMAELGVLAKDVEASAIVPEPSPLFWDHFSRRVKEAISTTSVPARGWWPSWRPMVAFGAMLVVAITTVVWRGTTSDVRRNATPGAAGVVAVAEPMSDDLMAPDESLDFMVNLASNLSADELQDLAQPNADVTAAALDQLTSAQRARLARLIAAEMGGKSEN
jgi:hypothetical protein